jgi:hypothetical protein
LAQLLALISSPSVPVIVGISSLEAAGQMNELKMAEAAILKIDYNSDIN